MYLIVPVFSKLTAVFLNLIYLVRESLSTFDLFQNLKLCETCCKKMNNNLTTVKFERIPLMNT